MRISRRDNLDRYYLVKFLGFGIFVHHIHHDEPDTFHTHPWDGFSLIFGSYNEEKLGDQPKIVRWLNRIKATVPHRVILNGGPVWTLFFHGRRYNRWQVVARSGTVLDVEPWRGVGGRTNYS